MATFSDLQNDISRDLGARAGNLLGVEIKDALNQAVSDFEHDPNFGFEEGIDTSLSTVIDDPDYTIPAAVLLIFAITIRRDNHDWPLIPIGYDEYLAKSTDPNTSTGTPPCEYAIFGGRIWLYQTPSEVLPIKLHGMIRQSAVPLVNDADTNKWTNEARQLIKCRAKSYIYLHRLHDPAMASAMDAACERQVDILVEKNNRLVMMGEIRQTRQF